MPMDQSVFVTVDTSAFELLVGESTGIPLLSVALELEPSVTEVKPVGVMPVVLQLRGRGVRSRPAFTGVEHQR